MLTELRLLPKSERRVLLVLLKLVGPTAVVRKTGPCTSGMWTYKLVNGVAMSSTGEGWAEDLKYPTYYGVELIHDGDAPLTELLECLNAP